MTTVTGRGKPKGWTLMDAGEQTLLITKVTGTPRTEVTNVEVEFVNEDGIPLSNNYDLEVQGGYAAFYYLVLNGAGVDLDEGTKFNINDLEGLYVLVEIVHKEGTKPKADGTFPIFANIAQTIGKGVPFDTEHAPVDAEAKAAWG